MAVKLNRNCDICKYDRKNPRSMPAIADVKLQASLGGQWAYVCETHFSLRFSDAFVTRLERES